MTIEEKKPLNIYQRLHAVMKEVSYVQKSQTKVNNQYTFVKSDDVIAKLRDPLLAQNVIIIPTLENVIQEGNRTVARVNVKFICIDNPTDYICVEYVGHGIDNQDKGIGKAITYAIKYALLKMFMIETGDKDDNEAHQIEYKPTEVIKTETEVEDKIEALLENFKDSEMELVTKYIQSLCKKLGRGKDVVVRNALKRIEDFKSGFENWKTLPV